MIEYTIVRSNRKTVAIYIHNGSVEVRAPLKATKRDIDKFVESKAVWISKNLSVSTEQAEQRDGFRLDYGSFIPYRGNQYPIYAKEGGHAGFDDRGFYIPPGLTDKQIKAACAQVYKMLAKRDIPHKVSEYSIQMGVAPISIKINSAKTRWGSCSSSMRLNFSWMLIMADDEAIDYVVVHELAHLTEMNHSIRFWKIVESVLPDYKKRHQQLKDLQQRLATEDWG